MVSPDVIVHRKEKKSSSEKGNDWEWQCINWLKELGFFIIKSYLSRGTIDFSATPPEFDYRPLKNRLHTSSYDWIFQKQLLVQAKLNGYVPPKERIRLRNLAKKHKSRARVVIMFQQNNQFAFKRYS